ncbi:hypothetical protein HYH03_001033 [Edaphochlamys debaryana]|uniref:Uncharacterized protein n=1 Tax=Edaphochlamys debaryana TaxID=47281 RepID=A0A836C6Y8_9CHLO|nr:hypothetical protein HYH03_001033 [Edaphochlamys debaryana]|eukprot:KAG2501222.1 hypothetical protein HYH03_001033 [Edaphochlamys debaryana]
MLQSKLSDGSRGKASAPGLTGAGNAASEAAPNASEALGAAARGPLKSGTGAGPSSSVPSHNAAGHAARDGTRRLPSVGAKPPGPPAFGSGTARHGQPAPSGPASRRTPPRTPPGAGTGPPGSPLGANTGGTPRSSAPGTPPGGLKSSLKQGLPRTVRATGRPADIEPLASHGLPSRPTIDGTLPGSAGNSNSAGGLFAGATPPRSLSPDPMATRPGRPSSATAPTASASTSGALPGVTTSLPALGKASSLTRAGAGAGAGAVPGAAAAMGSAAVGSAAWASGLAAVIGPPPSSPGAMPTLARSASRSSPDRRGPGGRPGSQLLMLGSESGMLGPAGPGVGPGLGLGRTSGLTPPGAGAGTGSGQELPSSPPRNSRGQLQPAGSGPVRTSAGSFGGMFGMPPGSPSGAGRGGRGSGLSPGPGGPGTGLGSNPTSPSRGLRSPGKVPAGPPGSAPGAVRDGRTSASPGAGVPRPGSKQATPTRAGKRQPIDTAGLFEVVTSAPGVIGEVRLSPELWCMDVWRVLEGGCPQQRAWTFGAAAVTNAAAVAAAMSMPGGEAGLSKGAVPGLGMNPEEGGGMTYTSPQPLALLNGIVFKSVAAGSHHGAAVSEEGQLYVWGSDSRGQLGRGWQSVQHVACHPLPHEVSLPVEASLEDLQGQLPSSLLQGIMESSAPAKTTEQTLAELDAPTAGELREAAQSGASETTASGGTTTRGANGVFTPIQPLQLFPMPAVHETAPLGEGGTSMLEKAANSDAKALSLAAVAASKGGSVLPGAAAAAVAAAAAAEGYDSPGIPASPSRVGAGATATESGAAAGAGAGSGPKTRVTIVNESLHVYRLSFGCAVRVVACGALHTLAALEGGGVWGWGDNASGQATGRPGVPAVRVMTPVRLDEFEQVQVKSLSAGLRHSGAVTDRGMVWCWGCTRHGRLGLGAAVTREASPARPPRGGPSAPSASSYPTGTPYHLLPSPPRSPLAGSASAAVAVAVRDPLPATASMLAHAGTNPEGLHEDAKKGLTQPPTPVTLPEGVVAKMVACGARHTLALGEDGSVWAWGANGNQALGLPDVEDRPDPVRVPALPPAAFVAASTVSAAICAQHGRLFLWGSDACLNPWGQRNTVGGPGSEQMTPRSAHLPVIHRVRWLGPHRFRSVALGSRHAVATTSHQRLYWWGDEEVLPGAMQYGATRLPVRGPEPSDFLDVPTLAGDEDGIPPPPPPPIDFATGGDPSAPSHSPGAASGNRLAAFRLFSPRDGTRHSDFLGGGGSPRRGTSGFGAGSRCASPVRTTGVGMISTGPQSPNPAPPGERRSGWGGFNLASAVGRLSTTSLKLWGEEDEEEAELSVRLAVFNESVLLFIRSKRSLPPAGSPRPRLGRPSFANVLNLDQKRTGSTAILSPEASLAQGFGPNSLGGGASAVSVSAAAAPGLAALSIGGGEAPTGPGSAAGPGSPPRTAGGNSGGGAPALPVGSAAAAFTGEEPIVLVACGEGQTICLCGQTRYNISLDETRHALMLVVRQYARHWHATRRLASQRLQAAGGTPKRVKSRTPDSRRPSSARSLRNFYPRSSPAAGAPWQVDTWANPFPCVEPEERPPDPRDDLASLDMLLVFCRQAGLIDNISEYNDVIELYRVQVTNKQARLPPSMQAADQLAAGGSNNPTGPINMLPVRLHARVPEPSITLKLADPPDGGRPGGRVGFGAQPSTSASGTAPGPGPGPGPGGARAGGSQPTTPLGGPGGAPGSGPGLGLLGPEASLSAIPEASAWSLGGGMGAAGVGSAPGSPERLPRTPGTPPSLRIVDSRHYMPTKDGDEESGPDERLHDTEVLDLLLGLMQNRQAASSSRNQLPIPALMRRLAAQHVTRLRSTACAAPLPWVMGQVIRTEMLRALDGGPNSLTLHQAYIFLTSEHSAPQDLHLSMQDMRLGLAQEEQPFTVPLLRLAQFIRQSGLLPKMLSRLISYLHKAAEYYLDRLTVAEQAAEYYLDRLTVAEQVPWWWPPEVLRERRAAVTGIGLSPTLWVRADLLPMYVQPSEVNMMALETMAGVVYDFDILGVYYGTTRKALRNQLGSEEQVALEHAKRDRLLAYVLVHLFGQYLFVLPACKNALAA